MKMKMNAPQLPQAEKGGNGHSMSLTMNTFLTFRPAPEKNKEKEGEGAKKGKGAPEAERQPASDQPESPEKALKAFLRAWAAGNKKKARQLMLTRENSDALWEILDKGSREQRRNLRSKVARLSFERLQPADQPRPDLHVTRDMVGPDTVVLRPTVDDRKWPFAVPVVRQGDRWKIDPSGMIEQAREERGESEQTENAPAVEVRTALSTLRTAQRVYKAAHGRYARSLQTLTDEGYLSPDDFEDMKFVKWSQLGANAAGGGDGLAQWKGSIEGYEWSSRYMKANGELGGSKK